MEMNFLCFKEHDVGSDLNPLASKSPGSGPWWSGLVTQLPLEDSVQVKTYDEPKVAHSILKPSDQKADQTIEKRDLTQLNIMTDQYCKNSSITQKTAKIQGALLRQSDQNFVELGYGQPTSLCGKYPYGDQCYGVFSAYGPQITGQVMLPLNLSSDDGQIFVNAKQYHGIIRRRKSRAKAEMTKKVLKIRKPYRHHSRHLHAMRRPRGNGGRFLNTKRNGNWKDENMDLEKDGNSPKSSNYAILLSDRNTLTSPHGSNSNRSHVHRSEVTNMFSFGDLTHFTKSNLSVNSLSNNGHGLGMHGKWIASTGVGSRCNSTV